MSIGLASLERPTGARVDIALGHNPTLGTRVREWRLRRDMSAEELAARARTSLSSISRIERGETKRPNYAVLGRIAAALGFQSIEALLFTPLSGEPPRAARRAAREPSDALAANVAQRATISPEQWERLLEVVQDHLADLLREIGVEPPVES